VGGRPELEGFALEMLAGDETSGDFSAGQSAAAAGAGSMNVPAAVMANLLGTPQQRESTLDKYIATGDDEDVVVAGAASAERSGSTDDGEKKAEGAIRGGVPAAGNVEGTIESGAATVEDSGITPGDVKDPGAAFCRGVEGAIGAKDTGRGSSADGVVSDRRRCEPSAEARVR